MRTDGRDKVHYPFPAGTDAGHGARQWGPEQQNRELTLYALPQYQAELGPRRTRPDAGTPVRDRAPPAGPHGRANCPPLRETEPRRTPGVRTREHSPATTPGGASDYAGRTRARKRNGATFEIAEEWRHANFPGITARGNTNTLILNEAGRR